MRVIVSLVAIVLAAEAVAAPAPFPRHEKPKPLPANAVVIDFSPLGDPGHPNWELDLSLSTDTGNLAGLANWTGSAGQEAPKEMAAKWHSALTKHYRDWLDVKLDPTGKKLILTTKPSDSIRSVKVTLRGLPNAQAPAVRTPRR